MSATTVHSVPTDANPPTISICSEPKKWLYLVPTIGALALGSIFIPHFALGMGAGAAILAINSVGLIACGALGLLSKDGDNEYLGWIKDHPFVVSIVGPILEEGIFRGVMQPLLARSIVWLVPAAAAAFLGTGFTTAAIISVVATGAIFGALHYRNPHKDSHFQAAFTTAGGIAYGLLSLQFGLGAAVAAHIINNTILSLLMVATKQPTSNATTLENRTVNTQNA